MLGLYSGLIQGRTNVLYVLEGIVLFAYGIWETINTSKVFMRGKQDPYGVHIKILGAGIIAVICGIIMIGQHIR